MGKRSSTLRRAVALAIGLLVSLAPVAQVSAEGLIIRHSATGAETLSRQQLRNLYLGKTVRLADGTRVVLTVLQGGAVHEDFLREYVGKTPQQFISHWRRIVFTGKGKMPHSFPSEEELVAFVASTPGAIGYISSAAPHEGVSVLTVEP